MRCQTGRREEIEMDKKRKEKRVCRIGAEWFYMFRSASSCPCMSPIVSTKTLNGSVMTGSINWRLVKFDLLHLSPTQKEHDDRISSNLRSIMTVGIVQSWDVSHLLPFTHRHIDRTMNGGGEEKEFSQSNTRAPTPHVTSNAIYRFQLTWAAGEGANHIAQTVR